MQESPTTPPSSTFAPALRGQRKLIILIALLLVAFGYFGFTAFQSATSYYLTVDELVERGNTADLGSVQVKGSLVADSFYREDGSIMVRFELTEGGAVLPATYEGVLPDLFFNEHSEIILAGEYDPNGTFVTDRVLIKCPTKYQSAEYDNTPADYVQDPTQSS
ncbi:MAG: cytochrome c maturation protein CcmE [Chloroflexi bacterium]|nr:cytochrome c maturation protein CcmE [Chloroflexota bacterium]